MDAVYLPTGNGEKHIDDVASGGTGKHMDTVASGR